MPRTTFSNTSLNAAAPGLSRLAAALGGGNQAYEQGFDQAATGQSKIALALAQVQAQQANAANKRQETEIVGRRPDLFNEQVANGSGTDIPTVLAYRGQLAGGPDATVPMGPPTEQGTMGATPLPSEQRSRIASALQQFLPVLTNTGDLNPEQLAKSAQTYRQSGLSDDIIAGRVDRNLVGGAQAAAAGKDLFSTNGDGAVLDQFSGGLNTANPLAKSTIGLRNAQASHASAQASLSRAQADVAVQGGKGVIEQTDTGMVLVNPKTGTAVPITGPDGVQVAGKAAKLKDIPATANQKIIDGQMGITNIDQAIAALEANPGATGFSNMIPGAQTVKQLWATPGDISTRAQVANIGSIVLHDRSGAAVSASEFPRLAPFIPSASDSPKVAAGKLREMKRIAEDELGLYSDTYSPDNGYRASPILQRRATDRKPGAQPPPGRNVAVDY